MKYKLMKDLPFMLSGSIFGKGSWVGGGWGVDRGETKYEGGGSSHNGITTFNEHQNLVLDDLVKESDITNEWIKQIPTWDDDAFDLYDKKLFTRKELKEYLTK